MPATNPRLTDDEARYFQEKGYLLHQQPVFTPDKFQSLKDFFERLLDAWEAEGKRPEHMDTPHFARPELFEWLFDDAVLDLVEPLIGPDIALFSSHFICKPPAVGKRVPWHEDSAYWNGRLDPMEVVTVWLAIDPSTPENGCMRVIPETHRHGFSEYNPVDDVDGSVFDREMDASQIDESRAVDCVLEPNQCSLHQAKCVHGSHANRGKMRRCGYTMRYMPTTVKFIKSEKRDFQIYLARGKDRAGNHYGDPTRPFKP